jgi:hypothetical protein
MNLERQWFVSISIIQTRNQVKEQLLYHYSLWL